MRGRLREKARKVRTQFLQGVSLLVRMGLSHNEAQQCCSRHFEGAQSPDGEDKRDMPSGGLVPPLAGRAYSGIVLER